MVDTTMSRHIVSWSSPGSPGGISVLYAEASKSPNRQRDVLADMLSAVMTKCAAGTTFSLAKAGAVIDSQSGLMVNVWDDSRSKTGSGTGIGQAIPNASQLLLRLPTADIVNGRFIRGRMFIPGLADDGVENGEVKDSTLVALNTVSDYLTDPDSGFYVWHRPTSGSGGSAHSITGGAFWAELAVLRNRRG